MDWTTLTSTRSLFTDPLLPVLGVLALRATLWLALALVAARLARTSAARHLALSLGLLGVLLLPLATILTPSWNLEVLPPQPPAALSVVPAEPRAEPAPPPLRTEPQAAALPDAPTAAARPATTSRTPTSPLEVKRLASRWPTLLWLAGLVTVLALLARAIQARARLAGGAHPIEDDAWLADASLLASELGTARPRLLLSDRIGVPITWGTLRPVLALPTAALRWSAARRRHALLHELVHVRRADTLLSALGRVACALAWFHPLVWWAAARQRAESELACDDRVVATGAIPSTYASELVSLARRLRSQPSPAVAALARPNGLEHRIRAILDGGRNREAPSAARVLLVLAAALIVALPAVAGVHLTRGVTVSSFPVQAFGRFLVFDASEESVAQVAPPPPPAPPSPAAPATAAAPAAAPPPPAPSEASHPGVAGPPPTPAIPAVPAVPAAPAAPAAPRPPLTDSFLVDCPGHRSTSAHADDDSWQVVVKTDRCRFELEMRGEIVFREDETGIERMGRGAVFAVDDRRPGERRALRLEAGSSGAPVWTWRVDGSERPVDAEARAWLAEIIPTIFRTTGLQAEERTRRILARGGVDAVLDEIELLTSDYVRRRYFTALMEAASLDGAQTLRWLRLAGSTIDSDYELATTLTILPADDLARADVQSAFVEAARGIDSDYEMRRALTPLVESASLSPHALAVMVELAGDIDSDYELATLLVALADRHASSAPLPDAFFRAARSIDSDYELARTLKKALEHPLGEDSLLGLLDTALSIESDYELASVLVEAAQHHRIEGAARRAYDSAVRSIDSGYERRRAERAIGS